MGRTEAAHHVGHDGGHDDIEAHRPPVQGEHHGPPRLLWHRLVVCVEVAQRVVYGRHEEEGESEEAEEQLDDHPPAHLHVQGLQQKQGGRSSLGGDVEKLAPLP